MSAMITKATSSALSYFSYFSGSTTTPFCSLVSSSGCILHFFSMVLYLLTNINLISDSLELVKHFRLLLVINNSFDYLHIYHETQKMAEQMDAETARQIEEKQN